MTAGQIGPTTRAAAAEQSDLQGGGNSTGRIQNDGEFRGFLQSQSHRLWT